MSGPDNIARLSVDEPEISHGRSLAGGVLGSIVASFCCLPSAVAIALGAGLGTVTELQRLLDFQRYFQLAGLALALLAGLWIARRRASCNVGDSGRRRDRALTYVFASFALSFLVLNLLLIPLLEHAPALFR